MQLTKSVVLTIAFGKSVGYSRIDQINGALGFNLFGTVCEKSHHTEEETIPSCNQVNVTHCYDGIGGHKCSNISKTECKLIKENVTKYFSPDVNV